MDDELLERPKSTPAERFKAALIFGMLLPASGAAMGAGLVTAIVLVLLGAAIGGGIDGTDFRARARSAVAFAVAGVALFLSVPLSVEVTGGAHVTLDETKIYSWQILPAFVAAVGVVFLVRRATHGRWGA